MPLNPATAYLGRDIAYCVPLPYRLKMNVPDPARYHQDTWDDRMLPRLAFDARGTEAYWAGRLGIRTLPSRNWVGSCRLCPAVEVPPSHTEVLMDMPPAGPGLVSSSSPVVGAHCPHFPSAQDKACIAAAGVWLVLAAGIDCGGVEGWVWWGVDQETAAL